MLMKMSEFGLKKHEIFNQFDVSGSIGPHYNLKLINLKKN